MKTQVLLKSSTLHTRHSWGLGFTLTELLITIVIVGILATVAIPAFTGFIANQRIKTASFDLMSALSLTRSEALKRNTDVVTVTPAIGGWHDGWTVTATTVGGVVTTLNQQAAFRGLTITKTPFAGGVTYNNSGRLSGAATTFSISNDSNTTHRCIEINISGRPNSKVGACL